MPNQGISSAFRFGEGYGALEASVIGHGYQTHLVTDCFVGFETFSHFASQQ